MIHSGKTVGIGVSIRAAQTIVMRFKDLNDGSRVFWIWRAVDEYNRLQSRRSLAAGVGHKPNTLSDVGGSNCGSWYARPFCIAPQLGQVSENSAKPSASPFAWASKQRCDVLHDDVAGS